MQNKKITSCDRRAFDFTLKGFLPIHIAKVRFFSDLLQSCIKLFSETTSSLLQITNESLHLVRDSQKSIIYKRIILSAIMHPFFLPDYIYVPFHVVS